MLPFSDGMNALERHKMRDFFGMSFLGSEINLRNVIDPRSYMLSFYYIEK